MEESLKRWSNLELAHQYPLMLQYWVLHFFIWPWWCSSLWKWFCFAKTNILLTSSTSILLWFPGVWWRAFWHQHPPQVPPYEEVRQGWVTANFLIILPISFFFFVLQNLGQSQIFLTLPDVTLTGLNAGLQTMKKGEFSRFLFYPQYAYGEHGCPPRIPAASMVLYEVEVLDFLDSGLVDDFNMLSPVGSNRNFKIFSDCFSFRKKMHL